MSARAQSQTAKRISQACLNCRYLSTPDPQRTSQVPDFADVGERKRDVLESILVVPVVFAFDSDATMDLSVVVLCQMTITRRSFW